MYLLKEYPKAISTMLVGIAVTYLTGKIPDEYLSTENINTFQMIIGGLAVYLFGRFQRLTKSEAELLNETEKKESRNQVIND